MRHDLRGLCRRSTGGSFGAGEGDLVHARYREKVFYKGALKGGRQEKFIVLFNCDEGVYGDKK